MPSAPLNPTSTTIATTTFFRACPRRTPPCYPSSRISLSLTLDSVVRLPLFLSRSRSYLDVTRGCAPSIRQTRASNTHSFTSPTEHFHSFLSSPPTTCPEFISISVRSGISPPLSLALTIREPITTPRLIASSSSLLFYWDLYLHSISTTPYCTHMPLPSYGGGGVEKIPNYCCLLCYRYCYYRCIHSLALSVLVLFSSRLHMHMLSRILLLTLLYYYYCYHC